MSLQQHTIFIVDDDPMAADLLKDHLEKVSKYKVEVFNTGEDCLNKISEKPGIVFLDYHLDSVKKDALDGLEVLREIKEQSPETEVVIVSGQDKIDVAVNTMKYGAFDYIVKGESSFYRAEKAVFNIYRYRKLQGDATKYRHLSIYLGITMMIMMGIVIWLQMTGRISTNPGVTF
jgi:DNA-binding NtrC family response regulator